MTYKYLTIVVPASEVQNVRNLCEKVAGSSGKDMFTCPLSYNGIIPPSHWCSSGAVDLVLFRLLSEPSYMHSTLQDFGIDFSLEDCETLLASLCVVDIETEKPSETFEKLGLLQIYDTEGLYE